MARETRSQARVETCEGPRPTVTGWRFFIVARGPVPRARWRARPMARETRSQARVACEGPSPTMKGGFLPPYCIETRGLSYRQNSRPGGLSYRDIACTETGRARRFLLTVRGVVGRGPGTRDAPRGALGKDLHRNGFMKQPQLMLTHLARSCKLKFATTKNSQHTPPQMHPQTHDSDESPRLNLSVPSHSRLFCSGRHRVRSRHAHSHTPIGSLH